MPDSPDYNRYLPNSNRFSLQDLGELAVRLDSPIAYDRRGDVVWYDDWRNGQSKWSTTFSGAGALARLDIDKPGLSGYNLLLRPGTTVSTYAWIYTYISVLEATRMGYEIAWHTRLALPSLRFQLWHFTSGVGRNYEVRLDLVNRVLYVVDNVLPAVQAGVLPRLDDPDAAIHHCKLIVDETLHQYVRLQLDNIVYNLSAYVPQVGLTTYSDLIYLAVWLVGNGGANQDMHVNHMILTANEP